MAASFSNGGAGFDGAQSLILPAVQAAGGYSFSVWVKPASPGGIIYQSDNVRVSFDGGLIRVQSGGASVVSDKPLTPGQWHHVGFTIADALRLYIDGKAAG